MVSAVAPSQITIPLVFIALMLAASSTTPPPVATTCRSFVQICFSVERSMRRKAFQPSVSTISLILFPHSLITNISESTKDQSIVMAIDLPMVVLPVQRYPIKKRFMTDIIPQKPARRPERIFQHSLRFECILPAHSIPLWQNSWRCGDHYRCQLWNPLAFRP